ncbi:MAG: hypothetical protein IKF22_13205 [Lachnospiraceae bacterium]|nr:hypothetical protein [Lachnospiraceae bacterium]
MNLFRDISPERRYLFFMQEMQVFLSVCCAIACWRALFAMKASITETHEKNRAPSFTKITLSEEFNL